MINKQKLKKNTTKLSKLRIKRISRCKNRAWPSKSMKNRVKKLNKSNSKMKRNK